MTHLVFFSGSAKSDSINHKLAALAKKKADQLGAKSTELLCLGDYPLPIFDEDLEKEGFPENAKKLKEILGKADGCFIASPEYNSSFTPLLKNVIDWCSRVTEPGEKPLEVYRGKVYALGAASPGGLGGIRGLVPLRMMLGNIAIHVTPTQVCVAGAYSKFDDQGNLTDDGLNSMLDALVKEFVETTNAVRGQSQAKAV